MRAAAEQLVTELLGAQNYWLPRSGSGIQVLENHTAWAARYLKMKLPASGLNYMKRQREIYNAMFARGFVRVAIFTDTKRIVIEFNSQLNRGQMQWLEDQAFKHHCAVTLDNGRVFIDAPEEPEHVR